jgi:hypothetical protein
MPFDDCEVALHTPQLMLLIVGDLTFFGDAVGKARDLWMVVPVLPAKAPCMENV